MFNYHTENRHSLAHPVKLKAASTKGEPPSQFRLFWPAGSQEPGARSWARRQGVFQSLGCLGRALGCACIKQGGCWSGGARIQLRRCRAPGKTFRGGEGGEEDDGGLESWTGVRGHLLQGLFLRLFSSSSSWRILTSFCMSSSLRRRSSSCCLKNIRRSCRRQEGTEQNHTPPRRHGRATRATVPARGAAICQDA